MILLGDVFRHYMVVFTSKDVDLISFGVTNPFSGKEVFFTNKELATVLFWTSTIYFAEVVCTMIRAKMCHETVLLTTNYKIKRHAA